MFGLIFNKPLAFCKSDFIVAKAESFLKKIGLYDLYVTECSSVERMLGLEWDYQTINHIIEIERNKSMLFLRIARIMCLMVRALSLGNRTARIISL